MEKPLNQFNRHTPLLNLLFLNSLPIEKWTPVQLFINYETGGHHPPEHAPGVRKDSVNCKHNKLYISHVTVIY